ncbi:Gp15 family bacteriophage protein [Enterocloster sp.]|jgi:hypothetical protein|uniref:Gp15 family bacteriophage protein n=1 Tax=Enterocloster sp. TaxID=2719315 RepID=UPI00174ADA31|nr:MAG TPA: hypothetical protein [Caudoviricetes sp.]
MRTSSRESSDPYYDLFEDWDLIVSSFLSQYGLRIRTKDFETVSWDEFKALIAGLSPETALGRVVAIRSETDKNVIKHFSRDQRRIYDAWQERGAKEMNQKTFEREMADLEHMLAAMCGGG